MSMLTLVEEYFDGDHFYVWPPASPESEKSRRNTLKGGEEALNQNLSETDSRAAMKRGCFTTIDQTKEQLEQILENVTIPDDDMYQEIDEIVKEAGQMWVGFGGQIFRIRLIMEGSVLPTERDRIKQAKANQLSLVVKPKLMRFGDSRGENLTKKTILEEGSTSHVVLVV